jgi:hypothetical protein
MARMPGPAPQKQGYNVVREGPVIKPFILLESKRRIRRLELNRQNNNSNHNQNIEASTAQNGNSKQPK